MQFGMLGSRYESGPALAFSFTLELHEQTYYTSLPLCSLFPGK